MWTTSSTPEEFGDQSSNQPSQWQRRTGEKEWDVKHQHTGAVRQSNVLIDKAKANILRTEQNLAGIQKKKLQGMRKNIEI